MLGRLHIRNYVLIDSLDIEFPAGLVIITGQTGAGKSILLGALSLALGAKADASVIGPAGDNCVVEATFQVEDELSALLEAEDIPCEGGEVVIRRVLARSGRSRSFVNDEPVNLKTLGALSARLLDIHSQHQTLMLSDRRFQLSLLDHYAGNAELLRECAAAHSALGAVRSEIAEMESRIAAMEADRDYNESRFRQLDEAALRLGELAELEAEQKRLANAEEIKSSLCRAMQIFEPEDDGPSMDSALKEASQLLRRLSSCMPETEELSARLDSARLEIEDIAAEVGEMADSTEISEDRLAEVEERLSTLYGLMKKFACPDEAALIARRDELSELLFDTGSLDFRLKALRKEEAALVARHESVCGQLHKSRTAASEAFAGSVEESLRGLELDKAVFKVEISACEPSATGADSVVFLFSSNGTAPVDVARCASGGEMSRIMLCLKALMARYTAMPAMIFDEIDTGVSGSVADSMGSMICRMGEDMQVFAITHLPQVAAKGNAHYLVSKTEAEDGTLHTEIKALDHEQRVAEIARMLSGSSITPEAVANAQTLLRS